MYSKSTRLEPTYMLYIYVNNMADAKSVRNVSAIFR